MIAAVLTAGIGGLIIAAILLALALCRAAALADARWRAERAQRLRIEHRLLILRQRKEHARQAAAEAERIVREVQS